MFYPINCFIGKLLIIIGIVDCLKIRILIYGKKYFFPLFVKIFYYICNVYWLWIVYLCIRINKKSTMKF